MEAAWAAEDLAAGDPLAAATHTASVTMRDALDGVRRGLVAGDPAELWAHSQALLEGAQALHATLTRECGLAGPALAAVQRGAGDSVRPILLHALSVSDQPGAVASLDAHYGLAMIALGDEDPGAVRAHASALGADPRDSFAWQAQWLFMWAALLEGDVSESHARARALMRVGAQSGNRRAVALARAGRGCAALADGDTGRAESLLQRALEALETLETAPWLTDQADTLEMLGVVAVLRGRPEQGVEILAAVARWRAGRGLVRVPAQDGLFASVIAEAQMTLGHDRFARAWERGDGRSLGAAIAVAHKGSRRERPTRGWSSLTVAERQVATLAATGLSNPAIGARLCITRGTAKVHLSSVYRKLGVSNRTELAALWAGQASHLPAA